jgi:hypothetical protein
LQSLAVAEIINALHLRDFRSLAIFEFFNTIPRGTDIPANGRFAPGAAIQQLTKVLLLGFQSTATKLGRIIVGRRVVMVGAQTTRNGAVAIDWHTTRTQSGCDEQRLVVIWNDVPPCGSACRKRD